MDRVQTSVDPEILQGLFQRDDGRANLAESVLNQLLRTQVAEQHGAERTDERQGYRNGVRERTMKTKGTRSVSRCRGCIGTSPPASRPV